MPRTISPALATILADPRCGSFSAVRLDYSDSGATSRLVATRTFTDPVSLDAYEPLLKRVSDIRFTLDGAVDKVTVICHNSAQSIGTDVAASTRKFKHAECEIGRYYYIDDGTPSYEYAPLFFGQIVNAEVSEREVRLEIVDTLAAKGAIIGGRPLTQRCTYIYKDPLTCGSTDGARSTCNKEYSSQSGCYGDATASQQTRFGGWWFPWAPLDTPPTGGGGGGGVIVGGGSCFVAGTRITMHDGRQKPIEEIRAGDQVLSFRWNDETRRDDLFVAAVSETFVHDVTEYYEFGFRNGSRLGVTPEHPLYRGRGAFYKADYAEIRQVYRRFDGNGLADNELLSMKWCDERTWRPSLGPVKVYNFHVPGTETYFANLIPVHNRKYPDS